MCLNRTLDDVNLVTTKRKPFDVLAQTANLNDSRGNWTPIELFRSQVGGWSVELRQVAMSLACLLKCA
jgi:hypothetical protein